MRYSVSTKRAPLKRGVFWRLYGLYRIQRQYIKHVVSSYKYFRSTIISPDVSIAPHPLVFYKNLIQRLSDAGCRTVTATEFIDQPRDDNRCTVLLRHDVDFAPEKLHLLVDAEKKLDIRSTIYVMADRTQYDIEPHIEYLRTLMSEGFEFGLHTTCYASIEHPEDVIREECEWFKGCFGDYPKTFTFHGMVYRNMAQIESLSTLRKAPGILTDGLEFQTEFMNGPFDWRLSDVYQSVVNAALDSRFKNMDFKAGQTGMVLTHPVHWVRAKL